MDGQIWRKIAVEYSEEARTARRLATLAQLKIDFLTKDELHDYLEWMADETEGEFDLSQAYRMYLGYSPNKGEI